MYIDTTLGISQLETNKPKEIPLQCKFLSNHLIASLSLFYCQILLTFSNLQKNRWDREIIYLQKTSHCIKILCQFYEI